MWNHYVIYLKLTYYMPTILYFNNKKISNVVRLVLEITVIFTVFQKLKVL